MYMIVLCTVKNYMINKLTKYGVKLLYLTKMLTKIKQFKLFFCHTRFIKKKKVSLK